MSKNNMELRVKFEIGEIKFEAEGAAELVERERSVFVNTLLPSAVEAIVRTRGPIQATQYIDAMEQPIKLLDENVNSNIIIGDGTGLKKDDFLRVNLASYIKDLGTLSEQDFTLIAAYFDEIKNGKKYFTKEDLERYYSEARRMVPSNISMSLYRLAEKGLIMDARDVEQKQPKPYIVSGDGIQYVKEYQPKQGAEKKAVTRKSRSKIKSLYADIDCDELNLSTYAKVKLLKDFKEKMMMVLYIVANEGKGEWFTTSDVLCIMTDIFGESATKGQVNGVFKREKTWFKSEKVEGNEKEVRRKLLNKGIEFSQSLITNAN
jgi:hypothetical protein